MYAKITIAAFFAGLAAAVHAPVGDPEGNPITRPLNEIVPAGQAFTITWTPTTENTVSILLLRGPSENVVPLGGPLAEGIANSGSFEWTPASDLEADTTHYGLQLIDDVTGQYQYSTQFGISNEDYVSKSIDISSTKGYDGLPTTSATGSSYYTATVNASSFYDVTTKVYSTGYPVRNGTTVVYPTRTPSVPATLKTTGADVPTGAASATTSSLPESTGAAAALRAGLSVAGAVAGLAAFIL